MKQPKHFFNLESTTNQNGESLIYFNLSYGYAEINPLNGAKKYIPLRISTEYSVDKKYWIADKKNKVYKANGKYVSKFGNDLNNTIEQVKTVSYTCLQTFKGEHSRNPSPSELKEFILVKLGRKEIIIKDIMISSYIEQKCKYFEALPLTSTEKRSKLTIKAYRNLANLIGKYESEKKIKLTFENLDETKYWDLFNVLSDIYKRDEEKDFGYTITNISRICKNLLFFLRQAVSDGFILKLNVNDKKGLKIHAKNGANEAYLNETELLKVINFDARHSSEFTTAKNYIIISSLTGLRFEDMKNLNSVEIKTLSPSGKKFKGFHTKIRKVSKQNNEVAICIPILKPVSDLLKKNNGKFPNFPTNQVLNRQIKKLCKHLEFDRILECKHWYHGNSEAVITKTPLHELAEAHVMRKTFYTNLVKHKININVIESITHPKVKNRNMSDVYNKTTQDENAEMFLNSIKKIKSKIYFYKS
jgi:hypothetical protein